MGTPVILDGRTLAKSIEGELRERVAEIIQKTGKTPVLAAVIVGSDPASVMYVKMKGNACERVGMRSLKIEMPEDSKTEDVIDKIEQLNRDEDVHGILLQHPVPKQVDENSCFDHISEDKDVDGVNTNTFGRMTMQYSSFKCATPAAIMSILTYYGIEIEGRDAVVIGRSPILGKPVSMLLLNANATVTICHSKTKDIAEKVRRADIVVAALGKPKFVKAEWIKDGAVLVDAGYNPGNVGDIDLENAIKKCSAYTPVPGGVGPMTISTLIRQTVESAEKKYGIQNK
jgi:methylenetetrahydrofolate dehydrogenase (NADP+) / methenyltetrahydrofolate cyclohydrolase